MHFSRIYLYTCIQKTISKCKRIEIQVINLKYKLCSLKQDIYILVHERCKMPVTAAWIVSYVGFLNLFFLHQYDPQLQNELLYRPNVDIYLLRSITSIIRKKGRYRTKYIVLTHPLRASLRKSHIWIWTHGRLTIIIDFKWTFKKTR